MNYMKLFSGRAHPELAERVCEYLGLPIGRALMGNFPDGEISCKIDEDVRGRDVFILQPTCPPVNENLMELLIMIESLKRASAERITAVMPYYGYARQDRKDEGRVPITAKLVANLITRAGVDRVLAMDLHSAQMQGFFDIPVDHLFAAPVMIRHLRELKLGGETVIMAPDAGGMKMVNAFAKRLGAPMAMVDKRRVGDKEVDRGYVIGEIAGKHAVIVDDMITTAGTATQAVRVCREAGVRSVRIMATHAVFCGPAFERLRAAAPDEVIVTNTIPLPVRPDGFKLTVLSVAELLGEAMRRIRKDESLSRLFV
jgi:ribose-phosphate pyrophosphokinase